jgi:peptide-methionine (S)-S-oxide reductase
MLFSRHKTEMITADRALPGRDHYLYPVPANHYVNGHSIQAPFPAGLETAIFGLGCFWGAERDFWSLDGVWTTAVGYSGGYTAHPTYDETCSGLTGHTEVVLVVFDPAKLSFGQLVGVFFEEHDPTQGMRQGNDIGTQYRSAIYYTSDEQRETAEKIKAMYSVKLNEARFANASTEIAAAGAFYYAEGYHQQYLAKDPDGYCGKGFTGVACPVGLFAPKS